MHVEAFLDGQSHLVGPRLSAEDAHSQRAGPRVEPLALHLVDDVEHVGRGHHDHVGPEVGDQLLTPSIRYSKPGLQSHISYLAGMTGRVDQKVGKDALDRYEVLKKELDALEASFNKIMGGGV